MPLQPVGIFCAVLTTLAVLGASAAPALSFHEPFTNKLQEGWSWVREDPAAWRLASGALEVRVQPGNMWGSANNARNVLARRAPDPAEQTVTVSVRIENRPTEQYEQVDLVWYYDDSHMVKIGQELVDGKLSVVMGREERDACRTVAIVPIQSAVVEVRLIARGDSLRGEFRTPDSEEWRVAGSCSLPVQGGPKLSLQCYQGPARVERWARLSEFRVTVSP